MDSGSVEAPPAPPPPPQGAPPPPPPPPPIGGAKIPTWREQQEAKLPAQQQIQQIQNDQYSNLPPQLMNSMNKDKKPFTYTPLAVGDKGKLDLSQIRSPRMKKRLLANMKEDEESGASTSESPCPYEPSPTPQPISSHSLDRSQTPDSSKMANKSEVPKIFKVPLPPKIDFTQELLARQREKQTPVNITSTPTAASFMDTNRTPMSPIELENTVDNEILGLHNALNQARPLEDISELINTRVPTMASTHPLADARVPASFGAPKHVPQNYSNDNGGYESSHHDDMPMFSQSNGTTLAPHPPAPPPTTRSSKMTTIPIRYENNAYRNQNDDYNSTTNNDNYNDYLYQASQQPHQQQNFRSNNQYLPRYDAQPVAPPREYFNIEPPKKIDILREIEQQNPGSYSTPSQVLGPSLGEQWAQKKQRQYPHDYSQPNYESYQIPFKSQPTPPPRPQPPPQYECNPQPMRYNSQPQQQQQYRPVNVSYDDERSEPTQSRSFKVLQKLTEGIEDEIQNLQLHEKQMNMQQAAPQMDRNQQPTNQGPTPQAAQPSPRPYPRGNSFGYGTPSNIPNNSFNYLQDLVPRFESDLNSAVYGNNYQNGQSRFQKENIIPVRLEEQSFPSYGNDAYRREEPPVSSRSYRMVKHGWESTRSIPYGTDF